MKVKYYVALIVALAALMTISAPLRAASTDAQIVSSAKDSYNWKTYLKGDDIKIESKDGVVTLTGTVAEGSHKSLAAETVESLPGVKSVDNQLIVKGAEPNTNSDAWIADKVKVTLMFHRSTNGVNTDVSVKDGKVTLRGDAASQASKDLTTEYAKGIDGVKDVDNQMTVSSEKTTTQKVTGNIDDASITAQVKYALLSNRSTSVLKTKVTTKNGAVTLSGKAKNKAEITLVTKLVKDINGVKSVNNQMTIE
jgi:hyperosmotically inducible protein